MGYHRSVKLTVEKRTSRKTKDFPDIQTDIVFNPKRAAARFLWIYHPSPRLRFLMRLLPLCLCRDLSVSLCLSLCVSICLHVCLSSFLSSFLWKVHQSFCHGLSVVSISSFLSRICICLFHFLSLYVRHIRYTTTVIW